MGRSFGSGAGEALRARGSPSIATQIGFVAAAASVGALFAMSGIWWRFPESSPADGAVGAAAQGPQHVEGGVIPAQRSAGARSDASRGGAVLARRAAEARSRASKRFGSRTSGRAGAERRRRIGVP